jgi:hypothetical protein
MRVCAAHETRSDMSVQIHNLSTRNNYYMMGTIFVKVIMVAISVRLLLRFHCPVSRVCACVRRRASLRCPAFVSGLPELKLRPASRDHQHLLRRVYSRPVAKCEAVLVRRPPAANDALKLLCVCVRAQGSGG